jgi:DNA-binding transcriptional MerR regulator
MMTSATTETITSPKLPAKSHFKLDEVCSLTGIKPYVLRFWESEFAEISPLVSSSGQKIYQHSDVESILKVKTFLFEKKWTIEQAKKAMSGDEATNVCDQLPPVPPTGKSARGELDPEQMKKLLQAKRSLVSLLLKTEQFKKRYQALNLTHH